MAAKKAKTINPRQRKFAEIYLRTFNATKAAREAGYSERSASSIGYELLRNPQVRAYIHARTCEQDSAFVASTDEALAFMSAMMRGEVKDQFDLDAALTDRLKACEGLIKRGDAGDGKAANVVQIEFVNTQGSEI